ncbi:MAG: hypothetical protein IKP05_04200 [Alphaproteobacteria bacterium]|nr:hypothetical protein [Alphaproteobacteria bacterium]
MKKSIRYRGNSVCDCDCEKTFTECEVIKQANALQKQYNFWMSINYKASQTEHTTDIDTSQQLPFVLKQLQDCAEQCRKTQEKTR